MSFLKSLSQIICLLLSGLLFSCSGTKTLQNGESLVTGNIIKLNGSENKDSALSKVTKNALNLSLTELSLQQPNKKFLFLFKARLAFYNISTKPEKMKKRELANKPFDKGLNAWIREKLGEPPVIFDSTLLETSESRMRNYLINQGYFRADVKASHETVEKKTKIIYTANPGPRFKFNNLFLEIQDTTLNRLVREDSTGKLIIKGEPYTIDVLKAEQDRITNNLNNKGFFSFSKKFINFEIDTGGKDLMKDVYMIIKNDTDQLGHKRYLTGTVTFSVSYKNTTLKRKRLDVDTLRGIYIYHSKLDMNPDFLARSIFYTPNDTFMKDNYLKTVNRLNELGLFRFINIKYKPLLISENEGYVDTEIVAEVRKGQSGKIELEANSDARNLVGTFINLAYTHRNIFHRADRLQINVANGVEFRMNNYNSQGTTDNRINALNLLTNARLYFPKIFPEFKRRMIKHEYKPSAYPRNTYFDVGYNLQRRLGFYNYTVNTFNIGYGYDIKGKNKRHEVAPIRISLIKPSETSFNKNFEDFLALNPIFALSYRQQFIMGQEYTFTYNSSNINVGIHKSSIFFRGNVNTAGNLVYAIQSSIKGKENAPFTLAKIPYATYTKIDGDFRYYINFGTKQSLVARVFAGTGLAYGNSDGLPFIKQFSAGGPQSMRGWDYRSLGPGSLDSSLTSVDLNTGDIQLEGNLEYRISLSKTFKFALFTDVGNVWLMRAQEDKPNANFDIKRLGQDLAWDVGFGIRLDFSLFVIRFDNAYKIYSPNLRSGARWINQYPGFNALNKPVEGQDFNDGWWARWGDWRRRYANFVIGIGYPF
jgi:outer membrane protein assembly factor BamA